MCVEDDTGVVLLSSESRAEIYLKIKLIIHDEKIIETYIAAFD